MRWKPSPTGLYNSDLYGFDVPPSRTVRQKCSIPSFLIVTLVDSPGHVSFTADKRVFITWNVRHLVVKAR